MRKSNVGNVVRKIGELIMRDIEKDVKSRRNIIVPNVIFIQRTRTRGTIMLLKKHAPASSKQSTVCSSCEQEFPSYYSLQQHRRKEHGVKQRKPSDTVADLNKIVEEEGEDGEKLKEELVACQHFLVDTEMENGRHKVINFQMSKLDTKVINEKLEEVFNKLDYLEEGFNNQYCSGFCSSKY